MSGDRETNCPAGPETPRGVDVGALADVPPGSTKRAPFDEAELTLANIDGRVLAVVDLCLRCSSPLSSGALRGPTLTCLHCGWQYDIERGEVVGLPALRLERYAVRVEDGRMLITTDEAAVPVAVT